MKGHKGHHHKHGGHVDGHHHHKHHHRKGGGRTGLVASGNPDVIKEAEGKEPYDKGDERKHGGKVKKHHRATGGKVAAPPQMLITGGGVRPRLDRPGRKMGGRVGADRSPLSSAHKSGSAESMPKSQDGGMSH
jgi:hypothetical protein